MPRLKKSSSSVLELAATRAAGLESIDTALDLGNGLSLATYRAALTDANAKLNGYYTLLSEVDGKRTAFRLAEDHLRDLSDRMLSGVASRFGRESNEYEKSRWHS